jgi:phytoene/squalene synthetase
VVRDVVAIPEAEARELDRVVEGVSATSTTFWRTATARREKRHEWLQRAVDLTFCGTRLNHLPPLQQMIERAIRECAGV